jgi:hypothetical protein
MKAKATEVLSWVRDYLGAARRGRAAPIVSADDLRHFVETRASHVAQTSLYGYIRARSGTRYPELFQNDEFVASVNIAKWQMWLACVSDLTVYAGGLVLQRTHVPAARVGELMTAVSEGALAAVGTPPDGGEAFAEGVRRVRARLLLTNWPSITDDDAPFRASPDALVEWAPIADELKQHDADIVKSSVRFRWQEVRRDLRRSLQAEALFAPRGEADETH